MLFVYYPWIDFPVGELFGIHNTDNGNYMTAKIITQQSPVK